MQHPSRPCIFILETAPGVTGSFIAARREAEILAPDARVVLALPRSSQLPAAELAAFDDVVRLPMVQFRKSARNLLLYLPAVLASGWTLSRAMRAHGCERLQVNDVYLMEGPATRLFGYRGRIVTWVRIDTSRYGRALSALWLKIALAVSSHLVAVSHHIAGLLPNRLSARVVYEPAPVRKAQRQLEVSPKQRFVFIGNYTEGKGQDAAIAAFERVAGEFPDAELQFHGGDLGLERNRVYRASLEARAGRGSASDRIRFGGYAEDTAAILAGAVAALNFSRAESFSLTCLEASACGIPVIATRCGGPEEIIENGVTGFLMPVGDVEAMADRMRKILRDPVEAAAMGRRGAELVRQRFDPELFRRALVELFDLPERSRSA